ncbi:sulfurtransferase TusA family protein [Motilimonas eburnea]|uniref:sulfurtransferase TusA family protein n=1 Tax=Motilimonas eburnea TaxID=1737488 RepID=UPI002551EF8E|nr:sulfurtransferase TusA family protein [Motilimonas eburnea]MCE2573725.1 sulfurtransferase TusA family protein [Motilimonas eburnea]
MTHLDCQGMQCPMPLIKMRQWLAQAVSPAQLTLVLDDPGSKQDIPRYLNKHHIPYEIGETSANKLTLVISSQSVNQCL